MGEEVNSEELVSEFLARGFDYLSNGKALGYLNDAYLVDICGDQDWSFLEATVTGAAPLTIPEIETIEYIIDTTQERKLLPLDRRLLTDENPTLVETGTPIFYYLTEGKVVNVFPVNTTDSLLVKYWRTPARLSGSATPLIPERFHSLIIDGAVARAYEDSDDYELAANAETNFQKRLQKMREALLGPFRDGTKDYVQITDAFGF